MINRIEKNTSFYSYYMNDEFYAQLEEDLAYWERDLGEIDIETERICTQLIYKECRMLDEYRFDEFLDLYSAECLYWIPITPGGGNLKKEVSHAFDDRRRLEDRIYRLRTGYAYSQIPMSRTRRLTSNIEASYGKTTDVVFLRTNFLIAELRVGKSHQYAGWYGYKLVKDGDVWKIATKMANLVDCDQGHENLTFMI